MQVGTTVRRRPLRLAAAALAAAFATAAIVAGAASLVREDEHRIHAVIGHVPSAADLDHAHGAFDRFREAPPAPTFDAARLAGDDAPI